MAIIISVRSVQCCAVVPGTERFRLSRKYIYCLWPQQFKNHHRNWHVCLFYESIETGWIETVCFTYIPKLNPVSDSKRKPVSMDHAPSIHGHGVIIHALGISCAQLTRDLFAIAKFTLLHYNKCNVYATSTMFTTRRNHSHVQPSRVGSSC